MPNDDVFLDALKAGFRAALRREDPDAEWDIGVVPKGLTYEEREKRVRAQAAAERIAERGASN